MKIGIMGGTFDPIHNGHLILSEHIREEYDLDKIIFIPTGRPPHKNSDNISYNNIRKEMVELTISDNPYFLISTIELDNKETSYTIDTIKKLQGVYRNDDLYLIIGGDSLSNLESWKDYEELISIANIIVADRYSPNMGEIAGKINELNHKYKGRIVKANTPIIHISSTDIRERISKGLSIKYLLPDILEEYIIKNNIYK